MSTIITNIYENIIPIAGMIGWWDASQLTGFNDGDPVTELPDLSGNGRDFYATNALQKPEYRASGPNGLPYLEFLGEDDYMEMIGVTDLGNINAASIFAVLRMPRITTGNGRPIVFQRSGTNPHWITLECTNLNGPANNAAFMARAKGVSTNNVAEVDSGTGFNSDQAIDINFRPVAVITAKGVSHTAWVDDHSDSDANIDPGWNNSNSMPPRLGYDEINVHEDLELCEMIAYDSAFGSTDRLTVMNYLKNKWGVT